MSLPPECWEHILSYVDGRSLVNVLKTCKTLNDIVELHPKLTDKLWIDWEVGNFVDTEDNSPEAVRVINSTRRKYRKFYLHNINASWFENADNLGAVEKLGRTVTTFATTNVTFESRKDLVDTLRMFPNLRQLQLKLVSVKDEKGASQQYLDEKLDLPNLQDLYLVEFYPWMCDLFTSENLKMIKGYIVKYFDDSPTSFENLVLKQRSLKKLQLGIFRRGRLFKEDRSSEVKFQLDKLMLNGAFYANSQHLLNFVKTQRKVKKLQITLSNEYDKKLDVLHFYDEVVKFILTGLPELTTLSLHQNEFKFPNDEFITSLSPNIKIEHLKVSGESVSTFTSLISVLPNIKRLKYQTTLRSSSVPPTSTINTMQSLESVTLENFFTKTLAELNLSNLRRFHFTVRTMPEENDFDENFKIFLQRHQSLTGLRIGKINFLVHTPIKRSNCEDIVANLPDLRELNIQHFADVNADVTYLVENLKNLSKMEVSQIQFKLVASETFELCSRNGVCIAVGK